MKKNRAQRRAEKSNKPFAKRTMKAKRIRVQVTKDS